MKNRLSPLTGAETAGGIGYLVFQTLFLPSIIGILGTVLPFSMDLAEANFLYYLINFLSAAVIFRGMLLKDLDRAGERPLHCLLTVVYGMGRYLLLSMLAGSLLFRLDPEFVNANDATVAQMAGSNLTLIAVGTIVLVPPAEECLFRGLIFRNLHRKNRVLAYLLSMAAFAAMHLLGHLSVYSPAQLLIAFLQYLPAGFCLAWAYERSGTIVCPILIHALVNAMGIYAMR